MGYYTAVRRCAAALAAPNSEGDPHCFPYGAVVFSFGIQDYGALLHIFESVCSPPPPKTKAGKNGVGKTGSTFDSAFPPEALPEVLKVASELADSFHVAA